MIVLIKKIIELNVKPKFSRLKMVNFLEICPKNVFLFIFFHLPKLNILKNVSGFI